MEENHTSNFDVKIIRFQGKGKRLDAAEEWEIVKRKRKKFDLLNENDFICHSPIYDVIPY